MHDRRSAFASVAASGTAEITMEHHRLRRAGRRRQAPPADEPSTSSRCSASDEPEVPWSPWTRSSRRSGGASSTSSTASTAPRGGRPGGGQAHRSTRSQSLEADGHQALLFAVLGHKADLGVMALGPDLARLQAFQQELAATPLGLVDSYVSLTELSEYTSTEDDERARLASRGGARRRRGSKRGSRRGASAWRTTRSSASTRSCR